MIKLQIIGNLGKDAVVNTVNGKNVINFSVAHTEKFKDSSGIQKDKTIWVDCAYWTDRTGIAPYLKKGTQVYADGTPDLRTYQTKEGTTGTSLSLRVLTVQLVGNKNTDGGDAGSSSYTPQATYNSGTAAPASHTPDMAEVADDLPF
jgi:single-strand DNA-binding protein